MLPVRDNLAPNMSRLTLKSQPTTRTWRIFVLVRADGLSSVRKMPASMSNLQDPSKVLSSSPRPLLFLILLEAGSRYQLILLLDKGSSGAKFKSFCAAKVCAYVTPPPL